MLLGQTPLPKAPSAPLQLDTNRAALSEDVTSRSNTQLLWTGFGFAVLMLMGLSVYAPSHALLGRPPHAPSVAFMPSQSLPARTSERTNRGVNDWRPWSSSFATPAPIKPARETDKFPLQVQLTNGEDLDEKDKDQKTIWARDWQPAGWSENQQEAQHDLGKMSGSYSMMYWLDTPVPFYSQSAVLDRPVPMHQRQTAPAPTRPPPPLPPKLVATAFGGESYLRRYTNSEAVEILDEWMDRVKVHIMGSQFGDPEGLAPVYKAMLQQLVSFRSFAVSDRSFAVSKSRAGAPEEKVLYGLYHEDHDKVLAIAGGYFISARKALLAPFAHGNLKINYIAVNPQSTLSELPAMKHALKMRRPSTFGLPAMKRPLDRLAKTLSASLVIDLGNGIVSGS